MRKHRWLRRAFSVLILLTVLFIWSNSLFGRETSAVHSQAVGTFVQQILDFLGIPWQLTGHFTRKAAHFLEFFLFGMEVAVYGVCARTFVRRDLWWMLGAIFGVGFMDETLQIFSDRGPMITDVWLDIAGGVSALLLVFACYFLFSRAERRRRR